MVGFAEENLNSQFFAGGEGAALKRKASQERTTRLDSLRKQICETKQNVEREQMGYARDVQSRLEAMTRQSHGALTDIFHNVRAWDEELQPVLKEELNRKTFNFENYCKDQMESLAEMEEEYVGFDKLTQDVPRHEVCRRFLTSLVLCNIGNVEILKPNEFKSNEFSLKLINNLRNLPALDDGGAIPKHQKPAPTKSGSKPKAAAAEEEAVSAPDVAEEPEASAANPAGELKDPRRGELKGVGVDLTASAADLRAEKAGAGKRKRRQVRDDEEEEDDLLAPDPPGKVRKRKQ